MNQIHLLFPVLRARYLKNPSINVSNPWNWKPWGEKVTCLTGNYYCPRRWDGFCEPWVCMYVQRKNLHCERTFSLYYFREALTPIFTFFERNLTSDNQIHVHHQVFVKLRVVTALPSQSLLKMSFIWLKILIEFLHDQLKFGPLNTNCMPANTGKIAHIILLLLAL